MTALETAVRRLIAERNRNVHGCAYRADLWNNLLDAYEAQQTPQEAPGVLSAGRYVPVLPQEVRP